MNTRFTLRIAAVAVAALFAGGAAYAGGYDGHDHGDQGGVVVKGLITVNAAAGASTSNVQATGDVSAGPSLMGGDSGMGSGMGSGHPPSPPSQGPTMNSTIGNNAAQGAKGNIALNSAAGMQNAQANDASIARIAAQSVFGSASVGNLQTAYGNSMGSSGPSGGFSTNAALGDSALKGASGNIAVNVAAGVGNAQSNGMAITQSANPTLALATATSVQQASGNYEHGLFTNTASIGGDALMNASGNIGVNVASGVGNLQHNGLSMIVAP